MNLNLTNEESLLIFTDQSETLEGVHVGLTDKCDSFSECPAKHFEGMDIEDIFIRQSIMKKIMLETQS